MSATISQIDWAPNPENPNRLNAAPTSRVHEVFVVGKF